MEKKVKIKLLHYEATSLCKFLELVKDTKPSHTDMNSKLVIACARIAREKVLRKMICQRPDYTFTFSEHDGLGILQAALLIPYAKFQVDSLVINKVINEIHQVYI